MAEAVKRSVVARGLGWGGDGAGGVDEQTQLRGF